MRRISSWREATQKTGKTGRIFLASPAQAMRHILVDFARSKKMAKRGGNPQRRTFIESALVSESRSEDLVGLDTALTRLAEFDERKSRVVEINFFGGLEIKEIAEVLQVSAITVKRDWSFARNWLLREMSQN